MFIPFVDLKSQYKSLKKQIDTAIESVLKESSFIGGKYVEKFETEFAKLYGVNYCVSVANGTDSLYIILKMLGIGQGDEVITVVNSWISSSETISQTGAKPVFVDIDPNYNTINEKLIEKAITSRTKAIMPVHLQGQMCNMDVIMSIAEQYNLHVIEDCAQSHFSEFKGQRAGTFGIAGSFSFYPGKNLGAYGDAGCIITNNEEFAIKCRMFARHGAIKKHNHIIEGINSRMDAIQAAILCVKLPEILDWTNSRVQNAKLYDKYLKEEKNVICPQVRENTLHSFHLYVIRVKERERLMSYLKDNGIETAIHYPVALHNMQAYKYLGHVPENFPIANKYQDEILSLPMYPELSEEQIIFISQIIKKFF